MMYDAVKYISCSRQYEPGPQHLSHAENSFNVFFAVYGQ